MRISKRTAGLTASITLAVSAKAKAMKAAGIDVVGFGAGEPDFDTPENIKVAAVKAINGGFTKYTPATGMPELKAAVAEKLKKENGLTYDPAQVVITCGGKHALFGAMMALLDPGDEVVIPTPYWVSYPDMAMVCEAKSVFVEGREDNGFKVTPKDLKAALTPRTKIVVLNSPSNPTGAAYTVAELEALADVIVKHPRAVVFSDEIYERLLYDGAEFKSFASLRPELMDRTLTFNAVSKTYSMTGWRIGYVAGPADIMKAIGNLQSHSTSNPSSMCQKAALEAIIGDQSSVETMRVEFDKRRLRMVEMLNAMPGVSCMKPAGAFYCFPNVAGAISKVCPEATGDTRSAAFCDKVLEDIHVAIVPGCGFGNDDCVRLSFATSMANIEKGLSRLAEYLKSKQ
ncbi:MAG: pyridoxal phosphate-dependent aminotransferase [Planctomycetes bacterium]|nr:pyridoxal phosphate-dependent aminotransferase [Planctomycetota bacterium]